jgi:hypothetical protein
MIKRDAQSSPASFGFAAGLLAFMQPHLAYWQ